MAELNNDAEACFLVRCASGHIKTLGDNCWLKVVTQRRDYEEENLPLAKAHLYPLILYRSHCLSVPIQEMRDSSEIYYKFCVV